MAQITTTQKKKYKYAATTEGTSTNPNGGPAPVDGSVVWTLEGNNTSGATLVPVASDPGDPKNQSLYAYFISGDTPQAEELTVVGEADADVEGEGETRLIRAEAKVTVIAAEAAGALMEEFPAEPK